MSIIARNMRYAAFAALITSAWMPRTALASNWSSTNVHYLYGWNFNPAFGKETHGTVTLEHVSGFAYGDNFFFLDVTNGVAEDENLASSLYGQWNPRFSLSKMTGASLSAGPIGDVLVTGELGYGSGGGFYQREYLGGLGFDLKVPGVPVLAINFWVRDTQGKDGVTYQISPYWGAPVAIGHVGFMLEGFLDFIGPEDQDEPSMITQPRVLLDLGSVWKKPGNLFVGTEVAIWWNKFGEKDENEIVPQSMVKWIF